MPRSPNREAVKLETIAKYASLGSVLSFGILVIINLLILCIGLKFSVPVSILISAVIGAVISVKFITSNAIKVQDKVEPEPLPLKVINIGLLILSVILISNTPEFKPRSSTPYVSSKDTAQLNRIKSYGFNDQEAKKVYDGAKILCFATGGKDC